MLPQTQQILIGIIWPNRFMKTNGSFVESILSKSIGEPYMELIFQVSKSQIKSNNYLSSMRVLISEIIRDISYWNIKRNKL